MKTCPNCNKQINDNDNFCMYCGYSYVNASESQEEIIHTNSSTTHSKNKINKLILIIPIIIVLFIMVIVSKPSYDPEEIYRGIHWGMTMDDVKKIESNNGSIALDSSENNTLRYELNDYSGCDVIAVYTFEGKNNTLSEFIIASPEDGTDFMGLIGTQLDNLLGTGEYNLEPSGTVIYGSMNWLTNNVKVEGLIFYSRTNDEAYFTFTPVK